jgi:anti-sigma regulatory factor (Ser/Thr protein kinase)
MPPCQTAARSSECDVADIARDWPLGSHLEFAALASAVPCARLHARLVLAEWKLSRLSEDAELLVSELLTNGIVHAPGEIVRLWLRSDGRRVAILVWDHSSVTPTPAEQDAEASDGRGLAIVNALSEHWGTYRAEQGKIVWCLLAQGNHPS